MMFQNGISSAIARTRKLFDQALDMLPHWRAVLRKPAALGYVLITAHRAQIALVLLFLFMTFLAPRIVDSVTGLIFPPETSRKVFGLIATQQANPWKNISYIVIMSFSWMTSIVSVMLLFWFHLPVGLARANARARGLINAADRRSNEFERASLYERALRLATDPELHSELRSLIGDSLDRSNATLNSKPAEIRRAATDAIDDGPDPVSKRHDTPSPAGLSGRYELGEQIGSGAMGVVYGAWDKVLDRKVAIKQLSIVLCGDNEYILRFRREAQALARLNHPNVVQVYDLLEEANRLWMVVEYVGGGDLASYLKDNSFLSVSQAVDIIIPIASGLALAHSQGIVHRDLKPANVLLTSAQTPKITDFGIAKVSQSGELTQTGSVLGSPPYMSPEQCSGGTVDSRTDIYALGITLYELLTAKKPFEGDTSSVLARHIVEPPAPLSEHREDIPGEVENLILQMLAKNPDERPSTMTEVAELLSKFKDEVLSVESPELGHPTA